MSIEEKVVMVIVLTLVFVAGITTVLFPSIRVINHAENEIKQLKADAIQRGYAEFTLNKENEPIFTWKVKIVEVTK